MGSGQKQERAARLCDPPQVLSPQAAFREGPAAQRLYGYADSTTRWSCVKPESQPDLFPVMVDEEGPVLRNLAGLHWLVVYPRGGHSHVDHRSFHFQLPTSYLHRVNPWASWACPCRSFADSILKFAGESHRLLPTGEAPSSQPRSHSSHKIVSGALQRGVSVPRSKEPSRTQGSASIPKSHSMGGSHS